MFDSNRWVLVKAIFYFAVLQDSSEVACGMRDAVRYNDIAFTVYQCIPTKTNQPVDGYFRGPEVGKWFLTVIDFRSCFAKVCKSLIIFC